MATEETAAVALHAALATLKAGGVNDVGVKLCERNRANDISDDQRPSLVMVDGDSVGSVDLLLRNGRAAGGAKFIGEFDIWGEVEAAQEDVGTTLNSLKNAIISVFANNAALKAALGAEGTITLKDLTRSFYPSTQVVGMFCLTIAVTCTINPTNPAA